MTDVYEQRIGTLLSRALVQGGEALVDRCLLRLGVALRHLEKVRAGTLTLAPMVVNEIEASFSSAEELLQADPLQITR